MRRWWVRAASPALCPVPSWSACAAITSACTTWRPAACRCAAVRSGDGGPGVALTTPFSRAPPPHDPGVQESGRLMGTDSVAAPFGVGSWDPHHSVQLSVAQGGDLVGFDIRSQWFVVCRPQLDGQPLIAAQSPPPPFPVPWAGAAR